MLYIQIPTRVNNWDSTIHMVDKTANIVDVRAVDRIENKLIQSGKLSSNMANNRDTLTEYVNSFRLKAYPDGRLKSSQRDVWIVGTDLDVKVDARDLVVIAPAYNVNGR